MLRESLKNAFTSRKPRQTLAQARDLPGANAHLQPGSAPPAWRQRGVQRFLNVGRLVALVHKESLQILRDPSSLVVAFVLPAILLILFGFGVSLDLREVRIGVVNQSRDVAAESLVTSLEQASFFAVTRYQSRQQAQQALHAGELKALVVVDERFSAQLRKGEGAPLQLLTDGTDANTARLLQGYVAGVLGNWGRQEQQQLAVEPVERIELEARMWFNPALKSRYFLVPGLMAMIMTLVGTLMTALVVAREWERGTMEALMATPVSTTELMLGKLLPFYVLGMGGMLLITWMAIYVFGVPFRGSLGMLLLSGTVFLVGALALGLLVSTLARDQFVASQIALVVSTLPAFFLSGFVFELDSAPAPIQWLSVIIPAKYFIRILQTLFLAGDVSEVIWRNLFAMGVISAGLVLATMALTRRRLE